MATCFQKSCCHAFTRVATWSVAQMQLASWKAVRGSHFGLCLTLECLQRASRWANHAITRQQSTDSKIYRIVIQDIVALHLLCSFQHLVFSCCREMRMKDLKTHTHTHRHTHTHTHTHDDYRMPWGSAHWDIITQRLLSYVTWTQALNYNVFEMLSLRLQMYPLSKRVTQKSEQTVTWGGELVQTWQNQIQIVKGRRNHCYQHFTHMRTMWMVSYDFKVTGYSSWP